VNRRSLPAAAAVAALVAVPQPALAATVPKIPVTHQCLSPPQASADTVPWAQQLLAPQRTWPLTRGAGVTVGVVDTGTDAKAQQLAGRVLPGRDVRNPGNGPADNDCFGHGTFVAGIIGAAPAKGTMFAGVAPDVTILPIRVADEATDTSSATLAKGVRAAVDGGARVVNVSASTSAKDGELEAAVAYAASRDVLVVASAGNSAQQGNPTPYPAAFDGVVAVGAIERSGKPASFSDTGDYLDLAAPGVDVCSIGPGGPGQWEASGTSYAAPFVAGVAALVRAYHPKLTAAQVKRRLEATADRPPANVPDASLGWGTVNPAAAVTALLPEEGTAGAVMAPAAPNAIPPSAPVQDRTSGVLVALSVLGVVLVAALVCLGARLVPIGMRRGWRPARRVEVAATEE
jgi:membrane-anchored mycosin MYCP